MYRRPFSSSAVPIPWLCALFVLLPLPSARAAILRVNRNAAGPAHDGSSWDAAFLSVQAGLDAAKPGDEVWVAAGTYSELVTLPNGVALYGGFAGTETQRSQRAPKANATILDGSANGTVVTVPVSVTQAATLDGFTVRNASLGGIHILGTATITNNTTTGNKRNSSSFGGGGIWVDNGSATIADNVISDNYAQESGGGIDVEGGNADILRNVISGNRSGVGGQGGGIYLWKGTATVVSNTIRGNSGGYGGGAEILGAATVNGNVISGNDAIHGGGLYVSDGVTVTNNVFSNNTADRGGAISAVVLSGGTVLANNTVVGNTATSGSIFVQGSVTIANSIIAYNTTGIYVASGPVTLSHNDVYYGGLENPTGENGSFALNPLFVNQAAGNYHLRAGSPCIDTGDDSMVAPGETDLDGKAHIQGAHVDIGAYEFPTTAYTKDDVLVALQIAGGMDRSGSADLNRLDVVPDSPSAPALNLLDAVRLARKVNGLDTSP